MSSLNTWYRAQPRLTQWSLSLSVCASAFLLIAWGKHLLFTPAGAQLGLGAGGVTLLASILALGAGALLPIIFGVVQIVFVPPRKAGIRSISWGLLPLLVYVVMQWLLAFRGIGFE